MRQLGARLPEPPRAPATRASQVPAEAREDVRVDTRPDHRAKPQHIDFAEERSFGIEAVPRQEGTPWGLLEPEQEHRFPFLTLAVPGIAAVLALGALLWSGSLRDRVRQQDSAMNALQAQNQKLADTLEEMSVEQRASSALSSSPGSQPAPPKVPATTSSPRQQILPPQQAQANKQSPEVSPQQSVPAAQKTESVQPLPPAKVEAVPAPSQQIQEKAAAPAQEPPRQGKSVETAHGPEIVPPYPTNYRPLSATSVAAPTATQQATSTYHQPFSVAGPSASGSSPARSSYPEPPSNPVQNARTSSQTPALPTANRIASADQYNAAGNGQYASSLADNIQAVQGLQRHSTVPLQEFHVHEGMLTKITPALGLSVRHPDPGHGTYSLLVDGGNSPYQLHGQVNNPLVFTDNTTHREYELVILKIADRQVYGYVRAMR